MHHWIWFASQLMTDASKSAGFCAAATGTDAAGRVTNTGLRAAGVFFLADAARAQPKQVTDVSQKREKRNWCWVI